jgi:hypothetical protein
LLSTNIKIASVRMFRDSLYAYIDPLERRIEGLEDTVKWLDDTDRRIEDTLNDILIRLTVPTLDEEVVGRPAEKLWAVKSSPYSYQPLGASHSEIRILILYSLYSSPKEQDPIACELLHASLGLNTLKSKANRTSKALQMFNTLSYTWGNLEKKGSVTVDGHQFPVTENLEAALRHTRNLKPPSKATNIPIQSFWWIDAYCINQDDFLERNQQVNMMTRIYKEASGVHI